VQVGLDSLLIAPERFTPQWGVFMGLRIAAERLRSARTDADLTEVAEWLWTMAVQIEDGDLSEPSASCAPRRSGCARRSSAAPTSRRRSA
jgi:hypothetical protein